MAVLLSRFYGNHKLQFSFKICQLFCLDFEGSFLLVPTELCMIRFPETLMTYCSGNEGIFLYGCDCSDEAVQRTKENINAANLASAEQRFYLFQCDFSASRFPQWLICNSCRESSLPERRAWSSGS